MDVGEAECLTTPAIGGACATGTTSRRRPSGPLSTLTHEKITYRYDHSPYFHFLYCHHGLDFFHPPVSLSSFYVSGTTDLSFRYDGHIDLAMVVKKCMGER